MHHRFTRRTFLQTTAAATFLAAAPAAFAAKEESAYDLVARVDRDRILSAAKKALAEPPITVTAAHSKRSTGGPHDYFSEGDYWWPDPKNPGGPYIRRDGFSNPANFDDHRAALIRLGLLAPALASAWCLTHDKRYVAHFLKHLNAWFVDPATKMNPNLQFAQAIFGVSTGRGTGIIDTLQLIDVARALRVLEGHNAIPAAQLEPIRQWFATYVDWMATSTNGIEEEKAKNNHGTCWVLQAAEFAQFAHRADLVALCLDRFKHNIVPDQIAPNGSLPLELARTKPYSYSLFDTDVLAGICQSLSTPKDNLFLFKAPNGGDVGKAVAFMFEFIDDKSSWPYPKDVEYFDAMPSRRPSILFVGEAFHLPKFLTVWEKLDANPTVPELIRNLPIRQPLLWVDPVLHPPA
ncbi:MAG: alginate lyase family protein [Acidobacteriota bacterium]